MRRTKMRIGKISTFIAQFTRPSVVNEPHVAASGLKAAPLLSNLIPGHGQAESGSAGSKFFKTIALFGAGASGFLSCTTIAYASDGAEHGLDCPCYPWFTRSSVVFQDACSSCHTMSLVSYRDHVGVAYTEEETKAMAAEIEVVDDGEMLTRPRKLSDRFPQPFTNEKVARLANGGAYPPDLSLITKGRHNGQNYVFSLLTGYRDPPAGVTTREGIHYNPYLRGGAIAMPKMLNDSAVEYEDGTPATKAEIGKDIATYSSWSALLNQKWKNGIC